MSLRDDLIAAKAAVCAGRTLIEAIDLATGDNVAAGIISIRSIGVANHLNGFRPKRKGRAKPSLGDMNRANDRDDILALLDRAIEAAS